MKSPQQLGHEWARAMVSRHPHLAQYETLMSNCYRSACEYMATRDDASASVEHANTERIFGILECEEARGREGLAWQLAKSGTTMEAAIATLKAAPKARVPTGLVPVTMVRSAFKAAGLDPNSSVLDLAMRAEGGSRVQNQPAAELPANVARIDHEAIYKRRAAAARPADKPAA